MSIPAAAVIRLWRVILSRTKVILLQWGAKYMKELMKEQAV